MRKLFTGVLLVSIIASSFNFTWAVDPYTTLDKVIADDSGVSVTLSGKAKYHAFKINNPPRVVVEFSNTEFNAKEKEIPGTGDIIKRVRGGQFKSTPSKIARIVVDLNKMTPYQVKHEGDNVRLIFAEKPVDNANTAAAPEVVPVQSDAAKPVDSSASAAPAAIENSAVTSTSKSEEAIKPAVKVETPTTANSEVPVKISKSEDTPIVIAQPVSDKEAANLNMVSAKSFKADTDKEKPMIDAKAESKSVAKSTLLPAETTKNKKASSKAKPASTPSNQNIMMTKKLITIDFDDADIREVFRILSMKSGINIIYGGDVSGTITLRLENVPFDKAFQTILSLKNLVSEEMGNNIIRVASPAQITLERAHAVTFTKIFPLNYAKADEIKLNLDSVRSAEGRQGMISVDQRTNTLIITDTPDGLISLAKIIAELDSKPVQVLIEAKIVEVVLNNDFDLGIQWQSANTLNSTGGNTVGVGQSVAATQSTAYGASAALGATVVSPLNTSNGGTGVTFPATPVNGEIGQIAFGIISNQANISGVLSALAQKSLSKLLSDPKVTTINNKEAKILVGQRIPYTTTTVTTAGSTQSTNFLDVGVKLTVTPTINADRKITLAVHPEVSLYVRADPAGPVIGTREANTTVIVNSGETVVIGGLITEQDMKQGEGVPLLQDLPVIGFLFKHQSTTKERDELLVFLTPQIID